jgi:carboxymethylenebutenolidase
MIEEPIEIAMPDGKAEAYLYHSERPLPGVLYLTDIGGIRDANRDAASRLAAEGYAVLMPNIFYRTSRLPVFDFPFRAGEKRSTDRMNEIRAPLNPEAVDRDASAYVDFLASQTTAAPGPFGVVGYCFSGAFAMRAAATRPDRIGALASFHGGGLYKEGDPSSPHLLLPRIRARLYFGHAADDRSMPRDAIDKFDAALAAWGGRYESEYYEGAHHGWTVTDFPSYNEPAAERAYAKLTALLAETLMPAEH